tara:strand:- start:676 stop:897 length:222 start_codon:yes stop_codon:yes gene_type:complete
MAKKKINELSAASKLVGAFFDGLKRNTTNRFLAKAAKQGLPKEVIKRMAAIEKQKKDLENLLNSPEYSIKKKK